MNFKMKTFLTIAAIVAVIVAYPLKSTGDAGPSDNISLTSDNLVILNGEVNSQSVSKAVTALLKLDKIKTFGRQKPIYLYLYSPGGSIQDGLELIEATKGLKRPVHTITMFAASMAFQIAQNLGDRLIFKNGTLMSHRASGSFEGSFGGQAPSQLDKRYSFWLKRIDELDEQTVRRTKGKQTMESYRASYANETWITGTEAVKEGYADRIVSVACDETLDGTEPHSTMFMGMQVHYETSKCPIITGLLNVTVNTADGQKINPILEEAVKNKFISSADFLSSVK